MKISKLFGAVALFAVVGAGAQVKAAVPATEPVEAVPYQAVVDACTADGFTSFTQTTMKGNAKSITYQAWGEWADLLRETMAHFKREQFMGDNDLLHAALDNIVLKMQEKYGLTMTGQPESVQHGCAEPVTKPLPELYIGQVDSCISDKSKTVSVLYGIVTRPTSAFRDDLVSAIAETIFLYHGDMEKPDELYKALTNSVASLEKRHGGETFFYFAPSGALQEGCHPARLAL